MHYYIRIPFALASAALLAAGGNGLAASAPTWDMKAPLPVARGEVAAAAAGGKIYVLGGTEQRPNSPPRWASTLNTMYDPATDRWTERAPIPTGLTHVGVAALDGLIYAVGGFTDIVHMNPQSAAFVYDPRTNAWSTLPSLPTARGSVAVVATGGRLHVFGGRADTRIVKSRTPPGMRQIYAGFGTVTTHDVYDPRTRRWTTAAPIPGPARDHVGIATIGGRIHLFGGRIEDVQDNLVRHDVYDTATDSWAIAAPLPTARSAGGFTVMDGKIVYAGGECKPGGQPFTPNVYDEVTIYDLKTDAWTVAPPLPRPRHGIASATVGRTAYFIGGAPLCGGGTSTDVMALRLSLTR